MVQIASQILQHPKLDLQDVTNRGNLVGKVVEVVPLDPFVELQQVHLMILSVSRP